MPDRVLITLDSLRWDVFQAADAPLLKSLGDWKQAWAQATYTFPAHMSAFVGKMPQTLDGADYTDSVAIRHDGQRTRRAKDFWRLVNPESKRPARESLEGKTIVEGFARKGCVTIGTGAMSWFNPHTPPGAFLTDPFDRFAFFDGPDLASHRSAPKQADWLLEQLDAAAGEDRFVFWNVGETHARFEYEGCPWQGERNPYGDRETCLTRQRACLEFIDQHLARVLERLPDADLVIFADHGEALGEDGLWGHGFCCDAVMRVPMLVRLAS
ncbi:MAG: sulfatase-like hydrolase/transferase [Phycisphaerales bacterium]